MEYESQRICTYSTIDTLGHIPHATVQVFIEELMPMINSELRMQETSKLGNLFLAPAIIYSESLIRTNPLSSMTATTCRIEQF